MTRLSTPSKSDAQRLPFATRVAALHRQADAWRAVVARIGPGVVEVLAARSFPIADTSGPAALLREHRVESLVHVIPSARTVCRLAQLPDDALTGPPAEVLGALSLQAEADLPASIPLYRRAAGLLRPGPDGSHPIPLLVGWQPGDEADPFAAIEVDAHVYVPEPIALAVLAASPAPAGPGGAETSVYADRASGTVAVFAAGAARSIARIARVNNSSPAAWTDAVKTAISQTRATVSLAPIVSSPADGDGTTLVFLAPAAQPSATLRVTGVSTEPTWRGQFGLALGAVLVAASTDAALAPFARLTPQASGRSGSPILRAVTWLAVPKRATTAIAACLAVLLLWPLGVAAARNWVLAGRSGGAGSLVERLDAVEKQATFYEVLRARRWPMTKLLSDLASAAPVGVTVESVELSPESGSTSGVAVRGTANTRDILAAFVKNLSDTRIFEDVTTPSINPEGSTGGGGGGGDGSSVDFRLQARVSGPLLKAPPIEDFAKKPLAARLYGEGATNSYSSSGSRDSATDSGRNNRGGNGNTGGGGGGGGRRGPDRSTPRASTPATGGGDAKPADIPPPISDAEIAKLDRAGALREFTTRNRSATAAGLEEATRARLKDEAGKAKQRMLEATKETPQ